MQRFSPSALHSVLDVGVTSDQSHDHSNYFEHWYPYKSSLTAAGLEDASFLERLYPGLAFVQASALDLPFDNEQFDFVHSGAVIEHVGSFDRQAKMLSELWRVSRRGFLATTPNRWFPVEFHTVLPLVHYLPLPAFRYFLRLIGRPFFAAEANLNLLSRRSLARAAKAAEIENFTVETVSLGAMPSNLLLIARKGL